MAHPIHRITSVEVTGTYRLRIGFDDGSSRNVDFEPIREWALAHRGELELNWTRAWAGESLDRIPPLD